MRSPRRDPLALLVLLLAVAAVGCGSTSTSTPTSKAPDWQKASSASGSYVAEFPGTPTTRTISPPGSDLSLQLVEVESNDMAFAITETPLNGANAFPLDEAVDRSIESARAGQQSISGRNVTATEISRSTGDFDGVETRRFSYNMIDGDKKATISSLIFYRDNVIVQAAVIANSEADAAAADRFLSSLTSRPA